MNMKKEALSCDTVQKNIPKFIDNKLDSYDTLSFVEHVKNCKACAEELSVEYLVLVGVKRLDSASAFDLNKELAELIIRNEAKAKQKRRLSRIVFLAAIFFAIIGGYFVAEALIPGSIWPF